MNTHQLAGGTALHSYALAVKKGPRPRHVLHVHQDGKSRALCGAKPVEFIGDALAHLDDECLVWPICKVCEGFALAIDPEMMEDWNRGQ